MEKARLCTTDTVYWVGNGKDIETRTQACTTSQEYHRSQTKEPLLQHEIPTRPWQILGTDLFYFGGNTYLIIADYYSKLFMTRKMVPDAQA